MVALAINFLAGVFLVISFFKDRDKARRALQVALKRGFNLLPILLVMVVLIGLLFALLPPRLIRNYLGGDFSWVQVMMAALLGTVTMIPSLISLPLAGSLVDAGAAYTTVAAFITTLTMVGIVTLPLEIKEMGRRLTFLRNFLAFIFAILISFIIGVIM